MIIKTEQFWTKSHCRRVCAVQYAMGACGVCQLLLAKERVHYGGGSCYSCRQFFRRITTSGGGSSCKFGGKCVVAHWEKRMCQACRYEKSLVAGMQPSLVLDVKGKKKRFKNLKFADDVSDTEDTHIENDVSDESSDEPFEFPPMTENAKEDYSTHESLLDPETGLTEIGKLKEIVSSEEVLNRKWKILQEDEQILNYVHKKFRKLVLPEENQVAMIAADTIKNIEVHPVSKDGAELDVFLKYNSKEKEIKQRKSVIVKRNDYEVEENFKEEEIIKIVINIKEIENMYLSEEKNYVNRLSTIFNEGWQSISVGDEVISEIIEVHQDYTGKTLSKEHFQGIDMQLRDRLLLFVFSLDDMDRISAPAQHNLLKKNLGCALTLTQLVPFNIDSVEEEMEFMFTKSDLAEMRSRDSTYQGYRARDNLLMAPFPDFLKTQLFNLIRSCSHPTLKDPVVFMLMVLIAVFKDPGNVEANHISAQYWTMLQRWLTNKVAEKEETRTDDHSIEPVESIVPALARCIQTLPVMMDAFSHKCS